MPHFELCRKKSLFTRFNLQPQAHCGVEIESQKNLQYLKAHAVSDMSTQIQRKNAQIQQMSGNIS